MDVQNVIDPLPAQGIESKSILIANLSVRGVSSNDRCRKSDVKERRDLKEDVVTRVEDKLRRSGHLEKTNESRLTEQISRVNAWGGKVGKYALENPVQAELVANYKRAKIEVSETDELA
ncbi:hypothetical protein EVAR_38251_1 [Eumeta japonica]|uniref:Uncharacterized protein n=1 Tax=Eumeta variegata TaxID=151549 RepID=A0A4C1Y7N3_EUMVA|nr:hypothetical protein EVAR_38251_1 [Eumeta japonica]